MQHERAGSIHPRGRIRREPLANIRRITTQLGEADVLDDCTVELEGCRELRNTIDRAYRGAGAECTGGAWPDAEQALEFAHWQGNTLDTEIGIRERQHAALDLEQAVVVASAQL